MKTHWWCCVLGLLCVPAGVMLSTLKVSQDPTSISLMRVNSSAEITCFTSLSEPMALYLHVRFPKEKPIMFLSLEGGLVNKNTPAEDFVGRICATPHERIGQRHGFTLQLSLLGVGDTNLYYCSWEFFNTATSSREILPSPGTIIIVRERDPQEQCRGHILDRILITLSVMAFSVAVFLCMVALIVRCKRFKRSFRPTPPRPNRPPHVCPQHGVQRDSYLITSFNESYDFRRIL